MGELEVKLAGKSLADYTNTQLRLALGAVLYTNTADMWKRYLTQLGYSGDVPQMLQKYYVDYSVPSNFRNYINAGASIFNPSQLFPSSEAGYIYDLSDLSTIFLDSAGTTAATVNGSVGLVLDKSKGLALGAELLSSGAIGVTGTATAATYNTSTGAGTVTRVDGSNQSFVTFTGLTSTAFYQVTIQNTGSNILSFRQGTFASTILGDINVGQTKTFRSLATTSQLTVTMSPTAGSGSFVISTFKSLAGNHAYQATSGSRPILRGTPTGNNLAPNNGDFSSSSGWSPQSGWTISGGVASVNSSVAGSTYLRTTQPAVNGSVYRVNVTVTSLTSGILSVVAGSLTAGSMSTAGTYEFYITANNSTDGIGVYAGGSGVVASIDNIDIRDVSASAVTAPYALQFDGVDDFLQTAAVNFTATDKMTVCHGVRKLSDSSDQGTVAELGTNSAAVAGFALQISPTLSARYRAQLYGTSRAVRDTSPVFAAPDTAVIAISFDIAGATVAEEIIGRRNGSVAFSENTLSPAGTGNFPSAILYFGRRGGASFPYNGLMFSSVCVGKTVSAIELASIERWVNIRTGAY
jgi:hypothetical protein